MGQSIEYHNDQGTKQHENRNHVHYETCGKGQKYIKEDHSKETEDKRHTKYQTGGRVVHSAYGSSHHESSRHSGSSHHSGSKRHSGSSHHSRSNHHSGSSHHSRSNHQPKSSSHSKSTANRSSKGSGQSGASAPKLSLEQRVARCYEVKRGGQRNSCNRKAIWQHGKYVRDDCGSGIVAKRYDFQPTRNIWCKTPLSMYQATIGEMARRLLCREISVPRDVMGEPPSNIAEYIMRPCRGYYRKYDCLRPCEDDYAVKKAGQKVYRDRVERYWEPCLSKGQKHKIDVNDYAPHNVFLGAKVRRKNRMDEAPCW